MECCNNTFVKYYVGTDLKFAIDITAEGFDMFNDNYSIELVCGNKRVEVPKSSIVDGGGNYYLLVDTTQFPPGTLRMIVYADVPDADFSTGVRREVEAVDLCIIRRTY